MDASTTATTTTTSQEEATPNLTMAAPAAPPANPVTRDEISPTLATVIQKLNDRVPNLRTPPTALRILTTDGRPGTINTTTDANTTTITTAATAAATTTTTASSSVALGLHTRAGPPRMGSHSPPRQQQNRLHILSDLESPTQQVATPSVLTTLARKGSTSPIPSPMTATETTTSSMPTSLSNPQININNNNTLQQYQSARVGSTTLTSVPSHVMLANTSVGLREIAKQIGKTLLRWDTPPRTILLVTKPNDPDLVPLTHGFIELLVDAFGMHVCVQDTFPLSPSVKEEEGEGSRQRDEEEGSRQRGPGVSVKDEEEEGSRQRDARRGPGVSRWSREMCDTRFASTVDLIVTLGGDGTVLYIASLFQTCRLPPILPFDLGSLGFLAVFDYKGAEARLTPLLKNPDAGFIVNMRMRIQATIDGVSRHVLNDIVIDRGDSPYMTQLELSVDGAHLTTLHADGLIISTPTGSTAYSLSAGGSMVHPAVPAMLLTPICPHTLSFRPMLLPDSIVLRVIVPPDARCAAVGVAFDGRERCLLSRGDETGVVVKVSRYPVPTVASCGESEDWIGSLRRVLGWNERGARQKPLLETTTTTTSSSSSSSFSSSP